LEHIRLPFAISTPSESGDGWEVCALLFDYFSHYFSHYFCHINLFLTAQELRKGIYILDVADIGGLGAGTGSELPSRMITDIPPHFVLANQHPEC
jgi:hypothetical protein